MIFDNRIQAGEQLAGQLGRFHGDPDAIVLGIPHGGVEVGFAVARALELPLDILSVRRLGLPGNEQMTMGAISGGGICVLKSELIDAAALPIEVVEAIAYRELREIERKDMMYRSVRPEARVQGVDVIVVDDGLVSGATMLAAVRELRKKMVASVIIATPLSASGCEADIGPEADGFISLHAPRSLESIAEWYRDFPEVTDERVIALLGEVRQLQLAASPSGKREFHPVAGDFHS